MVVAIAAASATLLAFSAGSVPAYADSVTPIGLTSPAPTSQDPTAVALVQAAASGHAVPIASATTPTQQVLANPDGSFTATVNPQPVRLWQGGTWVPVDATWVRRPDGSITTTATPTPITLSPGGTGPLATLTSGTDTVSFSWNGTLPTPTLDGNVATYPHVLPGVDLRVTATPTGEVSEVLVVADRQSAANPALAALLLPVSSSTLTPTIDASGGLHMVNAAGADVFSAPAPIMWDSPAATGTISDVAASADAAAHRSVMSDRISGSALVVVPDQGMLTSPATNYPVYIDPIWKSAFANHYTHVQSGCPTTNYLDTTAYGNPAAGYNSASGCIGVERAYYSFSIPSIVYGATISSGYVSLTQTFAGDNTVSHTYPVRVAQTGGISTSTVWPGPAVNDPNPAVVVNMDSGVGTNANFYMTPTIASAVAAHVTTWTVGVFGVESPSSPSLKRFATNPTLNIQYNHAPDLPSALAISPIPINGTGSVCAGVANAGYVGSNQQVTLSSLPTDSDGGTLTQLYTVKNTTTGWTTSPATVGIPATSGVTAKDVVTLSGSGTYTWTVQTKDSDGALSPVTAACTFILDTTTPATPVVSSTTFPLFATGSADPSSGTAGSFTLAPSTAITGGGRTVGYYYGFGGSVPTAGSAFVPADGSGNATLPMIAGTAGLHTLQVVSVAANGNLSSVYVPAGATVSGYTYNVLESAGSSATGYTPGVCTAGGCPTSAPFVSCRLFDTRSASGSSCPGAPSVPVAKIGAGATLVVAARGVGGIPSNATAVTINVTAVGATADTILQVHADGVSANGTSSLNVHNASAVANLVTVQISGGTGAVAFDNSAGSVDLVVDLEGYYSPWTDPGPGNTSTVYGYTPAGGPGGYPCRIFDTRTTGSGSCPTPIAMTAGAMGPGATKSVQIAQSSSGSPTVVNGVPFDAVAVVLNVTALNGTAGGLIKVSPHGVTQPISSALNYPASTVTPNMVVAQIGAGGVVDFTNSSTGSADVIVDLVGWYSPWSDAFSRSDGVTTAYVPMQPCRLFDTRSAPTSPCGAGTSGNNLSTLPATPVTSTGTVVRVAGFGGIPANATAILMNLTAVNATTGLTVYALPSPGSPAFKTSSLNPNNSQASPNLVLVKLGPDGTIKLSTGTGTVDLFGDIAGYYY